MPSLHRRQFLQRAGLGTGGLLLGFPAIVRGQNLNSRINVACIGVGGKGDSDVNDAAKCGGNIVALCDVDSRIARQEGPRSIPRRRSSPTSARCSRRWTRIDRRGDHLHARPHARHGGA